jgi:hypothetical protein
MTGREVRLEDAEDHGKELFYFFRIGPPFRCRFGCYKKLKPMGWSNPGNNESPRLFAVEIFVPNSSKYRSKLTPMSIRLLRWLGWSPLLFFSFSTSSFSETLSWMIVSLLDSFSLSKFLHFFEMTAQSSVSAKFFSFGLNFDVTFWMKKEHTWSIGGGEALLSKLCHHLNDIPFDMPSEIDSSLQSQIEKWNGVWERRIQLICRTLQHSSLGS